MLSAFNKKKLRGWPYIRHVLLDYMLIVISQLSMDLTSLFKLNKREHPSLAYHCFKCMNVQVRDKLVDRAVFYFFLKYQL